MRAESGCWDTGVVWWLIRPAGLGAPREGRGGSPRVAASVLVDAKVLDHFLQEVRVAEALPAPDVLHEVPALRRDRKVRGKGRKGSVSEGDRAGRGREITTHVKALQVEELGNLGLHGRIAPSTARGGRGGGIDLVTLRPAYRSIVTHQRLYLSLRLLFW